MKSYRAYANTYAARMGWPADGEGALCIEAAVTAAVVPLRTLMQDYDARIAAIRAAANGDLHPGVTTEELVRRLYHENAALKANARPRMTDPC